MQDVIQVIILAFVIQLVYLVTTHGDVPFFIINRNSRERGPRETNEKIGNIKHKMRAVAV